MFLDIFNQILTPSIIMYCVVGSVIGTVVGILPGISPSVVISLLLPITIQMPILEALVMAMSIFYGSQYGGSTSAILMKIAGEVTSIPTISEGGKLADIGKAGVALSISAISSFFAGIVNILFIYVFFNYLSIISISLGPSEYFCLGLLTLVSSLILSNQEISLNRIALLIVGILLGLIGLDTFTGKERFTFKILDLYDGLGIIILCIGIISLSELYKVEQIVSTIHKIKSIKITKEELRRSIFPTVRGTVIGSTAGLFPGGSLLSSFIAYFLEKKLDKNNEFNKGAISGVAAPEAANNAAAQSSLVPALLLGIPVNISTSVILGILILHNYIPGPAFASQSNPIFLSLLFSMILGNVILLVLNLPLINLWAKILTIPKKYIDFIVILGCSISIYFLNHSIVELIFMVILSLFGYILYLHKLDSFPIVIGFLVGPMVEEQFRRSMMLSKGELTIFLSSEINIIILCLLCILIIHKIYYTNDRNTSIL
jgi:TctA family transporter